MKSKRAYRVAELIQSTIALLLKKEVSDPRLLSASVTGVDLSPDFSQAIVYFSLLNSTPETIKAAEAAFKKATGFFRVRLSRETELRHTPQLSFRYDHLIDSGARISELLRD